MNSSVMVQAANSQHTVETEIEAMLREDAERRLVYEHHLRP
ncbi:MAG: hypothetical protein ACTS73_05230 [Arsenophonus sp. NEOnobi-MAG3]